MFRSNSLNKITHLEKNKVNTDSLKRDHKKFKKRKKQLILKFQQRFGMKKITVSSAEVNKTTLSANDDKRIQSIDSTEAYAYETSKDLECKKEKNNLNNIIKQ